MGLWCAQVAGKAVLVAVSVRELGFEWAGQGKMISPHQRWWAQRGQKDGEGWIFSLLVLRRPHLLPQAPVPPVCEPSGSDQDLHRGSLGPQASRFTVELQHWLSWACARQIMGTFQPPEPHEPTPHNLFPHCHTYPRGSVPMENPD